MEKELALHMDGVKGLPDQSKIYFINTQKRIGLAQRINQTLITILGIIFATGFYGVNRMDGVVGQIG